MIGTWLNQVYTNDSILKILGFGPCVFETYLQRSVYRTCPSRRWFPEVTALGTHGTSKSSQMRDFSRNIYKFTIFEPPTVLVFHTSLLKQQVVIPEWAKRLKCRDSHLNLGGVNPVSTSSWATGCSFSNWSWDKSGHLLHVIPTKRRGFQTPRFHVELRLCGPDLPPATSGGQTQCHYIHQQLHMEWFYIIYNII